MRLKPSLVIRIYRPHLCRSECAAPAAAAKITALKIIISVKTILLFHYTIKVSKMQYFLRKNFQRSMLPILYTITAVIHASASCHAAENIVSFSESDSALSVDIAAIQGG